MKEGLGEYLCEGILSSSLVLDAITPPFPESSSVNPRRTSWRQRSPKWRLWGSQRPLENTYVWPRGIFPFAIEDRGYARRMLLMAVNLVDLVAMVDLVELEWSFICGFIISFSF